MATTDAERVFVDTNVFLAATDTNRQHHAEAVRFLDQALTGKIRVFVTGQIFREYLVVATRPVEANGLGLVPEDAAVNIDRFRRVARVLPEDAETAERLARLVRVHRLRGKRIHDANVAAAMGSHGLTKLKTFNPKDFDALPDVDVE